MIVTPIQGRNGEPIAAHDGILFLFDRRAPQPPIGTPVEVMISHAPNRRYRPDYWDLSEIDKDKPENRPTVPFLIVRPVSIWVGLIGTETSRKGRLLLSGMAPRGRERTERARKGRSHPR